MLFEREYKNMENEKDNWKKIVDKLIEENLTISTMESCTGGGIANEITNISGATSVIMESYVTYCNEAKIKHGVPKEIIDKYTVYSQETAIEMAKAVKKETKSDIGIGVTGQLGRIDPSNPVDKLNCVWFAIVNENNDVIVRKIRVSDSERKEQKKEVLNCISEEILKMLLCTEQK